MAPSGRDEVAGSGNRGEEVGGGGAALKVGGGWRRADFEEGVVCCQKWKGRLPFIDRVRV